MSLIKYPDKEQIEKARNIEEYLLSKILGQEPTLKAISKVIARSELGYLPQGEPKSSFVLFGPTGVGKTETCLCLAEYLYGDRNSLIRFDMSEFMKFESMDIFLERMEVYTSDRENAGGILLFDEMEKAHPRVLDYFIQILSAGRLTYTDHKTAKLDNFYIFFTSNLGTELISRIRSDNFPFSAIENSVLNRAKQELRPELIKRWKYMLVYNRLTYDVQRKLAEMYMGKETTRWGIEGYEPGVLELVMRKGIQVKYGARPLKNTIEEEVRNALASAILSGKDISRPRLMVNNNCLAVC